MKTRNLISIGLLLGMIALAAPQWAVAAGTNACTIIDNNATLSYNVSGVSQPDVSTTALSGAQFTVGNKVMVTVEKTDGSAVQVVSGSSTATLLANNKVLTFTVTNGGNALQDYSLAVVHTAGEADPFGGNADSFVVSGVTAYVESGVTSGYQAAEDTATVTGVLNPNVTLAGETFPGTRTVYIVPNGGDPAIPALQADGTTAVYILQATTLKGDGTGATAETGGVSGTIYQIGGGTCSADIVYAEGTHVSNQNGEVHWDGKDTARDTYKVATAIIAVSKTSQVQSDPVGNVAPNAKAIPGAVVRYTISVANTGSASATLNTITDALDNALQVVSTPAGASWSVPASSRATKSGTLTVDTADANTDGLGHTNTAAVGGTLTATLTTILAADVPNSYAAGELKANETVNILFDATIQ